MINNTDVENKHPTEANIDTVYPITFSGATDSGGLPMFKVTLTYADGSSKELEYNVDYKLVYDDVQENNNESFNKPHLNGIKFLLPEYAVAGNTVYILRTTPFVQPVDFQIGRIDPEQIEKIADSSVLRDQEIRNQANKDRGLIEECQQGIATNAVDIQQVREEFVAEDARINKRIDDHAEELDEIREVQTTANTNIESNAKAIQKTRDDFAAADSVLRKGIDDNKSDITKLRDDMNTSDAALQGQITAQAAKIEGKQNKLTAGDNIIISGDVISAIGAGGGAGLSLIVYDTLPETGESGVIYLVPKDGAAPDVYDEYVWITATQTFELIGSTKVDLTDYATKGELAEYLPLSGGILTGKITRDIGTRTGTGSRYDKLFDFSGSVDAWGDGSLTYSKLNAEYSLKWSGAEEIRFLHGENSNYGISMLFSNDVFSISPVVNTESAIGKNKTLGKKGQWWDAIYTEYIHAPISSGSSDDYTITVPRKKGTMALVEDIAAIGGEGTTGQVLTKTDDGLAWQEPAGGTKVIFREWEE